MAASAAWPTWNIHPAPEIQRRCSALLRPQAALHRAAFSLFTSPLGDIWFDLPPLRLECWGPGRVHPRSSATGLRRGVRPSCAQLPRGCLPYTGPTPLPGSGKAQCDFTNKTHCSEIAACVGRNLLGPLSLKGIGGRLVCPDVQ